MKQFLAAAIQLDSGTDKEQNLKTAAAFVEEAAARGAKLISLPEQMNYAGGKIADNAEDIPAGQTFSLMSALAKKHHIWLHCGSIYERSSDKRPYNTTMVINPNGELAAKYSKLHGFDVVIKDGPSFRESDHISLGRDVVTINTGEVGNLGLSICYDMRFGELFRLMALRGAHILFVPANFTLNTGKDHWEPLLRARAIENGCYVIASAQCGVKQKFTAYGRSLIIDPWGNIIAQASDKPGIVLAEIDFDYLENIRGQVRTLQNRRPDIYTLDTVE